MKESINISLNPSYFCNLRCSFCYLSDNQLGDKLKLAPEILYSRLEEISLHRKIEHIDLYGGEIATLESNYLDSLLDTIRAFYRDKINIISNLTLVKPFLLREDVELSVSWDYFAREKFEQTYGNMLSLPKKFHVLILASDKLINMTDHEFEDFIRLLSALPNIQTVEIKPFSSNQHHPQKVSFRAFEVWVQRWLERKDQFPFEFINEKKIISSLDGEYSSWSDDHIYITPGGKFAVLEFDSLNREFFLEISSFDKYLKWIEDEKIKIQSNTFCRDCKYLGRCLSEHLQPVFEMSASCNGFYNLLNWWESERL